MTNRVGQQLGHYRLIRLLGSGGFAEVYLGEHLHLNTFAAVKILQAQLATNEVYQFRNEARTLAHLEHAHIVRVLDFGVEGSTPFLIMSYAPNGTLRQRHPHGAVLSVNTVVKYVKQIADGLHYAHTRPHPVIHRDIKPENMLLGSQNEVLLSDFGIAIVLQTSQAQPEQSIVGTVSYMAPEQTQGSASAASDQYALGVIVYEWLSGMRPFYGTPVEITTQHIHKTPTPLQQKVSGISAAVDQVVLQALEKDPHKRFASIKDFADTLEQAVRSPALVIKPVPPKVPRPTPVPLPPGMPPGTVPALPTLSVAYVCWPTFSISLDERRAIGSGKLPQVTLVATGQVPLTPIGPLQVPVTPPPLVTIKQQAPVSPVIHINVPPTIPVTPPVPGQSGGMKPIRSIEIFPATPVGQPVGKGATGGMNIIRSSASSPTPSIPSTPPTTPVVVYKGKRGVASLVLACLSIIPLITAFVVAAVPGIVNWESWGIFSIVVLAFFLGVSAVRNSRATHRTDKWAGGGISISVLVALAEATRLLLHYYIR